MKKLLLTIAAAIPLATLAATPTPPSGGPSPANPNARLEQMEKRLRVTLALGLAETLDLDAVQALKMQETLAKFEARRLPLWKALRESAQVLLRAARGDQVTQAQVDQAVNRAFESRAQLQQIGREVYQAITQGLSPQKRARAAIFLSRFDVRFGTRLNDGMMPGHGMAVDRGFGQGRGVGPMGREGQMGAGPATDCPDWGEQCAPGTPLPEQ